MEEFRAIIQEKKLDKAYRDYDLLKSAVMNADGNDTSDTSPTFKVLEEGATTLSKEESRSVSSTADEVHTTSAGCHGKNRKQDIRDLPGNRRIDS